MINTKEAIAAIAVPEVQASVNNIDAQTLPELTSSIQVPVIFKTKDLKPSDIDDKQVEISKVIDSVKALESEHCVYVEQYISRGNLALYALLSKVYALAIQINMSDNKDSILKSLRNAMSLQKNIKTQKNSSAITMIVRWVVGGSRQLAHTYSKALEAAYNDNISASRIVDYFSEGGLSKAKKKQSEQAEAKSNVRMNEFKNFMYTADAQHKAFLNTEISWTEEVFMNNSSGHVLVLGHHNGGGSIQGYRAFNLTTDAYNKICKILADELFKQKREDEITAWVDLDRKKSIEKRSQLRLNSLSHA